MPLLKIWNALWGRSADEKPAQQQPASASPAASAASKPVNQPASKSVTKSVSTGFGSAVSSGLNLFASNPHGALCKLVAATEARLVLELGVGDGSRAVAMVATLSKRGIPVRYFGIDEFELTGGSVSLKDFHRTLRSAGIRPQLFPEPVERGLVRFLHTVGHADLVIVSDSSQLLNEARFQLLLSRVSHATTTVLYRREDSWARLDREAGERRRAA